MSKNSTTPLNLRATVYCALFTALIIIGAYISIPIGPIPGVLSDFFVMITALFLGWKYGLISVLLYLGLGAIGMPVFAGGASGIAALVGPTGGFLFGFLLLVAAIGFMTEKLGSSTVINLISLVVGNVFLYASGIIWFKFTLDVSWGAAIAYTLTPFILGTVIKIIVAVTIGRTLVPRFKENVKFI